MIYFEHFKSARFFLKIYLTKSFLLINITVNCKENSKM